MLRTAVLGTGHYVPERVVTNDELAKVMTTSDEWIQQRTGVQTRRYVDFDTAPMGTSDLATRAAERALAAAQVSKDDIDLIVYATLSPDKVFPGDGVLMQAKLDIPAGVPALDVRNQCSGFLYGLATADAFIRTGSYRRVLLVGAEVHSTGLDFSDRGRDISVIFGDGAAAVVLGPTEEKGRGVLSVKLHADGRYATELEAAYPSSAVNPRIDVEHIAAGAHFAHMNGKNVFKHAVARMPEAVMEVLAETGLTPNDIDLFIPHQANLRITEMVTRRLELSPDKVVSNIQRYGNTTAASIPLALDECVQAGRVKPGSLVCMAAFGSGFTWGAALVRW
ncbi:MAG: beta-ketoacyl-ACP synthase III [Myxococcota bacterium]